MNTALLLIGITILLIVARILVRQNQDILESFKEKETVAPVRNINSPNRLPRIDPDVTYFDENNPLTIPKNVKFEIEGGDNIVPPEYI